MTKEHARTRARIRMALEIVLGDVAADKRCQIEDLSIRIRDALENYGLECYRLGDEDAHERPTLRTDVPVPDGVWESVWPPSPERKDTQPLPAPPRLPSESRVFTVGKVEGDDEGSGFDEDAETPLWRR